jgi:hypothetical protein
MRYALVLLLVAMNASGALGVPEATVRVFVTGGFGQTRTGCEVERFESLDEPLSGGGFREYTQRFKGLEATRVPYGRYRIWVQCPDATRGVKEVQIERPVDFEVVATSERRLRMHDIKPLLKITMKGGVRPRDLWWIRLVGTHVSADLSAHFAPETAEAIVIDPPPGRYLVMVQSAAGYFCVKRLDIFDAPERWRFDPPSCTFELDSRAREVSLGQR